MPSLPCCANLCDGLLGMAAAALRPRIEQDGRRLLDSRQAAMTPPWRLKPAAPPPRNRSSTRPARLADADGRGPGRPPDIH